MSDSVTPTDRPIDHSPSEVKAMLERGEVVLIDVREPFEHQAERIEGAVPMPLGTLDAAAVRQRYAGQRIVFHCAGGVRSAKACAKFALGQDEPTHHLAGGIAAWKQAGLPTLKPAKAGPIPMMRQVQIAAGGLVVMGLLLGWFVSPWFLWLSGFVGCGLMFAGVTGWCGMAKLLSRLPWNKV